MKCYEKVCSAPSIVIDNLRNAASADEALMGWALKPTVYLKPYNIDADSVSSADNNNQQLPHSYAVCEPCENANVEKPFSNTTTLLHLLKCSLPLAVLAMPSAFVHAGYALGPAMTVFIGFLCAYTSHMILHVRHELTRRRCVPTLSYPETVAAALAEGPAIMSRCAYFGGQLANMLQFANQLGTCCIYVMFVANNLKAVVDLHYPPLDLRVYMAMMLLPLTMINWVRNRKWLNAFFAVANILTIIALGICMYYVLLEVPCFVNRQRIGDVESIPLSWGAVLFAMDFVSAVLPLERKMRTPLSLGGAFGVLNQTTCIVAVIYMCIGYTAYFKYGNSYMSSITLNLPEYDILAQVAKIMMAVAIFLMHAQYCCKAVDIITPLLKRFSRREVLLWMVRTVLVLATLLLAVAVPSMELFISLFGALCGAILNIILPAIIETSAMWHTIRGRSFLWLLLKNLLLTLLGLTALFGGTYYSIVGMIQMFE